MNYHSKSLKLIECNLDDMNPELFPEVIEHLLKSGANDAWVTPIIMKQGRPAQCLSVLCLEEYLEELCQIVFAETSTLGLRVETVERYELQRESINVPTQYGEITIKLGKTADGRILNAQPEHRSCKASAELHSVPTAVVFQAAIAAYQQKKV